MSDKNQVFQQALELIIDGVALGTETESRAQIGAYLMGLVVADNQGKLDNDKVEAIEMSFKWPMRRIALNLSYSIESCCFSSFCCSGPSALTRLKAICEVVFAEGLRV